MTFHIGQKVVCVRTADDLHQKAWAPAEFPKVGNVYHIRGYAPDVAHLVLLVEIDNKDIVCGIFHYAREGAFPEDAFRPIVERKTDIGVFTEMLTKTGVDA